MSTASNTASSMGKATRIEGSCALAQMTIAIAIEAEPSCKPTAACLGLFGRASEMDGDGSRFPRRGGDKSEPRIECGLSPRVVRPVPWMVHHWIAHWRVHESAAICA